MGRCLFSLVVLGARTAQAIVDAAINELKKTASVRLGGKTGSGESKKGSGKRGSADDVIELTDSNFESMVLNSDDIWLVEFFAPWCGHCKNLKPHWEQAAAELKGKVKVHRWSSCFFSTLLNFLYVLAFLYCCWFTAKNIYLFCLRFSK